MILYRPVGLKELELIYDSGMKAFPARLPQQPIFYPVLDLEYARQTASDWNVQHEQFAGYVTEFKVEDKYIDRFEEHRVGKSAYRELWVPAAEMDEFNKHIVGHIRVVEAYFGKKFKGFIPDKFGLASKNAVEQFTLLSNSYIYKRMEFYLEIKRNHRAVFLNYPFWHTHDFKNPGLKEKVLQAIREAWLTSFPQIPLPNPVQKEIAEQPDAQTRAKPVQKGIPPAKPKQTPAQPSIHPVYQDAPPLRQRPAEHSMDSVDDDDTLEEEKDSGLFDDALDEEDMLEEQTDSFGNPLYDQGSPNQPMDPRPPRSFAPEEIRHIEESELEDLIEEDPELEEQTDVAETVKPDEEDSTPLQPTTPVARHFVKPVNAETPPHPQRDPHFVQGIQLGLNEQYRKAIEELSRAVEQNPEDVIAQTSLGVAFHRAGQDDRALACYENALTIDPIYAEAHYFRANILYGQEKVREAIAGYTVAIGLQPDLIEAHLTPPPEDRLTDYTGSPAQMYRIAKPAHRILTLNKLLGANPRKASLLKERAAGYYRLRNYAQAIADYSSALSIQPEDADAFHLRGVAYEQLGQSDRALEDFQNAMAINPQLSNEYINRGVAFGQRGNLHQAIASLTEAIRLAPGNPDGYFNRGTAYLQQGDFEKAMEDFSRVIPLSPTDEEAYYWRGISFEEMGRQQDAIADYRQFLALSQDENARAQIEQKLRQWKEAKRNDPDTARSLRLFPQGGVHGRRASSRNSIPEDEQEIDPISSEKPNQVPDLYGLMVALGERVLDSTWFGTGVQCFGEKAEELYAFTNHNRPIQGRQLLQITSGIDQTIEGDFQAFDPDASSPWIFIRAWHGDGFYIETNDPQIKKQLVTHFRWVEELDEASPPYEGLFLRTPSDFKPKGIR